MNSSRIERSTKIMKKTARRCIPCALAILFLHASMVAKATASPTEEPATNPRTASAEPEAPNPATGQPKPAQPSLAEAMQQEQRIATVPQRPFSVPLPHSHNPIAPYMPSMPPPLDLTNSPRLLDLTRDGKLYVSLHDAIALAIENNLDLAYFRYNFPVGQMDLARTKAGGAANGESVG